MNPKDGPFKSAFETDATGVVKQELTTYRVKNGMFQKETVTRDFTTADVDYIDSTSVQPLVEIN